MADDSDYLYEIENDAMAAFGTVGLYQLANKITPAGIYDAALAANRVWIAETADHDRIGFLAAEIVDGNPYLKEVSVLHIWQGKGVGRTLIAEFLSWARQQNYTEATLTTFRDLQFNGSFYKALGFREIDPGPNRPELAVIRAGETWLDSLGPRVAMALTII